MKNVGYYNGQTGPLEDMSVPMNDRSVYFGDGCYEATCFENHVPFAMEEHLDRLYNSCRLLDIKFDMPREELREELVRCVEMSDSPRGMLYWQVSRGTDYRHHDFPDGETRPNLLITVRPTGVADMDKTYKIISMEDVRFTMCNIKTVNLLPNVLAAQKTKEAGCNECVFHRGDVVTECSHSNIHIIKDGVFRTHQLDNHILPGITRKHLLEICAELGIPTDERAFTMAELADADEIITSSSSAQCMRVLELDGKPVGGKNPEIVKRLQAAYAAKYAAETSAR